MSPVTLSRGPQFRCPKSLVDCLRSGRRLACLVLPGNDRANPSPRRTAHDGRWSHNKKARSRGAGGSHIGDDEVAERIFQKLVYACLTSYRPKQHREVKTSGHEIASQRNQYTLLTRRNMQFCRIRLQSAGISEHQSTRGNSTCRHDDEVETDAAKSTESVLISFQYSCRARACLSNAGASQEHKTWSGFHHECVRNIASSFSTALHLPFPLYGASQTERAQKC